MNNKHTSRGTFTTRTNLIPTAEDAASILSQQRRHQQSPLSEVVNFRSGINTFWGVKRLMHPTGAEVINLAT